MVERAEAQWWSIPQAIVWIVSRDVAAATDADRIRFLPEIERLPLPHSFSIGDEPPIGAHHAPDVLLSAIRRGTVEVVGRVCGKGEIVRVSLNGAIEPCLKHHDGGLCIVDDSGGFPIHYWSELAMRPDECMRRWPGAPRAARRQGSRRNAGAKPTKRHSLKVWIRSVFPGAIIPASMKNSVVLADFASATKVSVTEKTLQRALEEIRQEDAGQNRDRQ
jgi:hypothetical protein